MKNKNYVIASKVSERLTGTPLKVRRTSKRFKEILERCNYIVEQILTNAEMDAEQKRLEKTLTK